MATEQMPDIPSAIEASEPPLDAPPVNAPGAHASPGARQWLLRGVFEAGLILLGLLGAFALDEWHDSRARADRADAVVAAIRAELEANLALQETAAVYNTEVVARLKKLRDAGQTFVPAEVYQGGLMRRPQLTSAAWTAAQEGEILDEIPVGTILVLAKVYESQRSYVDATGALFASLYETALRNEAYRMDGTEGAAQLGGVLSDFSGRGAALVRQYQFALAHLEGRVDAPVTVER